MNPFHRILRRSCSALLTLVVTAAAGTGCTHYANVTEIDSPDGVPTYVSSRTWSDGTPRTVIVERVLETEGACELLEVRSHYFAPDGLLDQRAVEMMKCGVVETSTVDDFDPKTGRHVQVIRTDANHDGEFDSEQRFENAVSVADLQRMSEAVL
jgi:hypothetical protein